MLHVLILSLFLSNPQDDDKPTGEKVVQMKDAAFYKAANRASGVLRQAKYGEKVNVVAIEKETWAKCDLGKDTFGYLRTSALISPKKFVPSQEGEVKEGAEKSEQYGAGKGVTWEVEEERRKKYNLGEAFDLIDKWSGSPDRRDEQGKMIRPAMVGLPTYRMDRTMLETSLRAFRREGKLGEFSK
jgi:hypothetical protein